MKVQTLVLGKYDNASIFCLYRFSMPVTPPLNSPISTSTTKATALPMSTASETKLDQSVGVYFYCLEDLERLAILAPATSFRQHVNTLQLYRDYPNAFFKNEISGYTYANNHVLCELASRVKSKLLTDLCQLTERTPLIERYSLLQQIPSLDTKSLANLLHIPSASMSFFSNGLPVQLVEQVLHPVRLDGQEWFLQPSIQHQQASSPQDEYSNYLPSLPPSNVGVMNMGSKTKKSSLLLQCRLAPKFRHHAQHLTINTPSYKDRHHYLHSIQSAPLRKSISEQQINKRLQAAAAASAAVTCHSPPSWNSGIATTEKHILLRTTYDALDLTQSKNSKLNNTIQRQSTTSTISEKRQLLSSSSSLSRQNNNNQVTSQMGQWVSLYLERMEQCLSRLLVIEKKVASRKQQQQQIAKMISKVELFDLATRLDRLERKQHTRTDEDVTPRKNSVEW